MRHCFVVRVFTMGSSGGNALGVIPDATGLDAAHMQRISAQLGFSETVFIDWPVSDMPALRIFTPVAELPFAGHPLVGTAWVLNHLGPGASRMRIETGEVGVRREGEFVWVAPPPIDMAVRPVAAEEAGAVGVSPSRAWRVQVPSDYLLAELGEEAEVVAAAPDLDAVAGTADGLLVFQGDAPVRARFFAPRLGVAEDPATGSAAVALAAVRRSLGREAGTARIVQGLPGSLSEIHVTWNGLAVELGGSVVEDGVRVLDD